MLTACRCSLERNRQDREKAGSKVYECNLSFKILPAKLQHASPNTLSRIARSHGVREKFPDELEGTSPSIPCARLTNPRTLNL